MRQTPPEQMPSAFEVGRKAMFKFVSSDGKVARHVAVSTFRSMGLEKHCAVSKQTPLPEPSPPPKTSPGLKSGRSSESTADAMHLPDTHVSSVGQFDTTSVFS